MKFLPVMGESVVGWGQDVNTVAGGDCMLAQHSSPLLTLEEPRNLLVPECDVSFTIVLDDSQRGIGMQVVHELCHSLDAMQEVGNLSLFVLLVECLHSIVNGFSEDGGETLSHGLVGKGILMVSSVGGPRWVVGIHTRRGPLVGLIRGSGSGWECEECQSRPVVFSS